MFSPTLALLWISVDTRMVIWYVFDNGKHQTPLSDTLKQRDPFQKIHLHSTERNLLLSKFDTSSCGAVLQSIAWCVPPLQCEFKLRLFQLMDSPFKDLPPHYVGQDTHSWVWRPMFWGLEINWQLLTISFFCILTYLTKTLHVNIKTKRAKKILWAWGAY